MSELERVSLGRKAARNLATTTKTPVQTVGITPRYLLRLLPWVGVQAGTYRINRRKTLGASGGRLRVSQQDDTARVEPEALRALPILADADGEFLESVAARLKTEAFDRGQTVVRQGDPGDKMYIIATGRVEVISQNPQGERSRLAVLSEGEYFGESRCSKAGRGSRPSKR